LRQAGAAWSFHHGHWWLWIPGSRVRAPRNDEHRHCERSEAIYGAAGGDVDCFVAIAPRDDGRPHPSPSFRDAPLGAGPESITTKRGCCGRLGRHGRLAIGSRGYGFRARCYASPRNDGGSRGAMGVRVWIIGPPQRAQGKPGARGSGGTRAQWNREGAHEPAGPAEAPRLSLHNGLRLTPRSPR
jgi:hypothetical protein